MDKKVINYTLAGAAKLEQVVDVVNAAIKKGYVPHGSMLVDRGFYIQPLVQYKESVDDN